MRERKHIRLRNHDYSSPGVYFITICTDNRKHFFGEITNMQMTYTPIGEIALQYWNEIPHHFPQIKLRAFVIMPNHIHGIMQIICRDTACRVPTNDDADNVGSCHGMTPQYNQFSNPIKGSISTIIGQYKSSVTRWCNKNDHSYFGWQSKFHDHVVRSREEYDRITNYINTNIQNWKDDCFFSK